MSKKISPLRALILEIEKLYSKISLRVLHKRINSYHANISDDQKKHHESIKKPLMNFIESTISQAVKPNTNYSKEETTDDDTTSSYRYTVPHQRHQTINKKHIDELSKYFKARSKDTDLHPAIKDKLGHSVWEHIHATVRCARLGDERNAKMHLDIASTACKELGHYMDDEEYKAFIEEAEKHMDTLTMPHNIS